MPHRPADGAPPGFLYRAGLLTRREEFELSARLAALRLEPIVIRGRAAKRTARHFGLEYAYASRGRLTESEPLPEWLEPVRARAAELAGIADEALVEALVQHYPPEAAIGWHRDSPAFGIVAGVSLGSACRLRFRRADAGGPAQTEIELEPGSGYVLAGEARSEWQHSIPPVRATRYSVTFRTVVAAGRP